MLSTIRYVVTFFFLFFCADSIAAVHPDSSSQIQTMLNHFRETAKAPAAVVSISFPDGKIQNFLSGTVLRKTKLNPNPENISTQNLFQIGSITKSFFAAIILQLEAEGKLSIHDTIATTVKKYGQWLPEKEYKAWKNITIKQLLNMTSGIFDVTEDSQFNAAYLVEHPQKQWIPADELAYAYRHPAYFPPGKGWHYSNTDYILIGMLIEKITGHSAAAELQQRILNSSALNLADTYYFSGPYPENILKRMAHGYAYPGGEFSPPAKPGTDMTAVNMSVANTAGAMISNTIDLTHWVRDIFTGRVLAKQQLSEMLMAVCTASDATCHAGELILPTSTVTGFSLGLAYMRDSQLGPLWVYVGGTAGFYSAIVWFPQQKISAAMTVSASSAQSKKILKGLVNMVKIEL